MPTRRQFLAAAPAATLAGLTLDPARSRDVLAQLTAHGHGDRPAGVVARDETYWAMIAQAFTVDRSLLNLNHGGVSAAPAFVQQAMKRHLDFSNQAPSYTMWRVLAPQIEGVRRQLARHLGCDPEEVAITRNASEGLQTCQFGFDLERGDVVLTSDQDYPRMISTFEQRQRREGIKLIKLPLPQPCDDPAEIVEAFTKHMDKHHPKLVLMSHMLFTTGQVMPVREVVAAARERGIPVIVDGAHAFAHLDFTIDDLGCDYYATSLHKWLFAPHGTGLLFVRRDKIKDLWPLMAAPESRTDDIRKFEEIGTHPLAGFLAIAEALTFHQGIGAARKLARLVYLREYWTTRLVDRFPDRFVLNTSREPGLVGGIANVQLKGVDHTKLGRWLMQRHRIITTQITGERFQGMRVSPSICTTLPELDRFCATMQHVVEHGLPT